jgi:hypothetical protein
MVRSAFVAGMLGWVVPGIVAIPIAVGHESAGGEAALGALIVWFGLSVIGSLIGGISAAVAGRESGRLAEAFLSGVGGVSVAWLVAIGAEIAVAALVTVLHTGGLGLLMPLLFLLALSVGFGLCALVYGPRIPVDIRLPRPTPDSDGVDGVDEAFAHLRDSYGKDRR